MRKIDWSGRRFGQWTVLRRAHGKFWLCQCDCGEQREVYRSSLAKGVSTSCGCLRVSVTRERSTRHGESDSPLHVIWQGMRKRCSNPNAAAYRYYGERGITICERWDVYENFRDDMGASYRPGLTIERINVNGHYEPDNCTWIERGQQAVNRRVTVFIDTPKGRMHLAEAERAFGLKPDTIGRRRRAGWAPERWLEGARESDIASGGGV